MKGKSLDEVVRRLARESLSRRRRSAEKALRILAGAGPEIGEETSTFPPVRCGSLPEVSVKFRVHFTTAKRLSGSILEPPLHKGADEEERTTKVGRPKHRALTGGFTEKQLQQIRAIEPALLNWMAGKKENAARYFADPVGALKAAGVKLDPILVRKIKQQRRRSLGAIDRLPRAHIDSIEVEAED